MQTTANKVLSMMERLQVRQVKTGEYRSNSPFRASSDSNCFSLMVTPDGERGAFYDHVSGDSGSLYELARHFGIELPDHPAASDTKRVYRDLADYAAAHGISAQTLMDAGWHYVNKDARPALEIPTATGNRWRFLDDKKPSYKSTFGYRACWYGDTPKLRTLLAKGCPLVLCNGEVSTITAQHYGVAAICATGGEKRLPDHLLDSFAHTFGTKSKVLIAYDCDATGRRTALEVQDQLTNIGVVACTVDLKLPIKGGDLADFCHWHGIESNQALAHLSEVKRTKYLIHAADLANLPPITWLVAGEVPSNSLVTIYGLPGSGKSFIALHYALTVASDKQVVYVAGEGLYGLNNRINAWKVHYNGSDQNLYVYQNAIRLMSTDDLRTFLAEIGTLQVKPSLIVFDTLARCMVGGDENNTRDMVMFIDRCNEIMHSLGCTVMLVHHANKSGREERGSSSLRAACDVMIKVAQEDDLRRVSFDKVKDAKPEAEKLYKLLTIKLSDSDESCVLIEESASSLLAPELSDKQVRIMEMLNMPVYDEGCTLLDLETETQYSRGAVRRALDQLMRRGYVSKSRQGINVYFVSTNTGKTYKDIQGDIQS